MAIGNVFRKDPLSEKDIVLWLATLRENCFAPESDFLATAVFRAGDCYFGGVNVENIDHRLSTHAEEAAIAAMVAGLGADVILDEAWVMGAVRNAKNADSLASCCGKCRQQMSGFAGEDVKVHSVSLGGKISTARLGALLPDAFRFDSYAKKSSSPHKITGDIEEKLIRQRPLSEKDIAVWLQEIESVDAASKISQSAVLKLENGAFVAGSKVEDAAFLGLSAAQSAMAIAVTAFGNVKIIEASICTRGREIPDGNFGVLPMSSLQTLLQGAGRTDIPLRFFTEDGSVFRTTLLDAAALAPVCGKPFYSPL